MNDTLGVVVLVCVAVLLWDRFSTRTKPTSVPVDRGKQGTLDERIAQMIQEEGF